jgi:hypothetical protein
MVRSSGFSCMFPFSFSLSCWNGGNEYYQLLAKEFRRKRLLLYVAGYHGGKELLVVNFILLLDIAQASHELCGSASSMLQSQSKVDVRGLPHSTTFCLAVRKESRFALATRCSWKAGSRFRGANCFDNRRFIEESHRTGRSPQNIPVAQVPKR